MSLSLSVSLKMYCYTQSPCPSPSPCLWKRIATQRYHAPPPVRVFENVLLHTDTMPLPLSVSLKMYCYTQIPCPSPCPCLWKCIATHRYHAPPPVHVCKKYIASTHIASTHMDTMFLPFSVSTIMPCTGTFRCHATFYLSLSMKNMYSHSAVLSR